MTFIAIDFESCLVDSLASLPVLRKIYRMVSERLLCLVLAVSVHASALKVYLTLFVVGAMFYLSPQLTALMLCVVPPVSLGAVRVHLINSLFKTGVIDMLLGVLWPLS